MTTLIVSDSHLTLLMHFACYMNLHIPILVLNLSMETWYILTYTNKHKAQIKVVGNS